MRAHPRSREHSSGASHPRNASALSPSEQTGLGRCYGLDQPYLNSVFPRWRDIGASEHAGWRSVCLGQWGGTVCRQMRVDAEKANLSGVSDATAREALLERNHVHLSPLGIACAEDIEYCNSAKISGRPRSEPQSQPPRLCPLFVAVREAWIAALARALTARARRSCERRMRLHLEDTIRKAEADYATRSAARQRRDARPVGRVVASAHRQHHR